MVRDSRGLFVLLLQVGIGTRRSKLATAQSNHAHATCHEPVIANRSRSIGYDPSPLEFELTVWP
jgi:hypothetical protein